MGDLMPLATLAVAVLGFVVAWAQWTAARSALILNLFEHRREAYSAFRGPVAQAIREGRADTALWAEFVTVIDQAQFLFGREVLEFIKDHSLVLNDMGLATSMLSADRHLSHEERAKFANMQAEAMRSLVDFYPGLIKLMTPYMLMDQKRPWSIGRISGWFGWGWRQRKKEAAKRRKKRVAETR
jgi:hypothetical protein